MSEGHKTFMVTGSRYWHDGAIILNALLAVREEGYTKLLVGDATGADFIALNIWARWGLLPPHKFVADWARWGKAAGPIRNQEMVDAGPTLCLAFPLPGSRGTWDAVSRARRAGMEIRMFNINAKETP